MRVAVIMRGKSISGGGGAERRFGRVINHYNGSIDLLLITNKELVESLVKAKIISSDIKRLITYKGSQSILGFNYWLIRKIKILKPDVIHLPLMQFSLFPFYLWLYLHQRYKVVHTVASSMLSGNGRPSLARLGLARILWNRANIIDALYPSFIDKYGENIKIKTSITPCSFTDYELYRPDSPKDNLITFSGRLIPEKNPLLFIEALELIWRNCPDKLIDWEVIILGNGPLKKEIQCRIEKTGLDAIVTLEKLDSVDSVINRSSIFLSLQSTENYPSQSLLEAMAAGNAIIATDVGDTRRLIDKEVGLLVKTNTESIAKALMVLIGDDGLRKSLGKMAAIKVRQNHNIDCFEEYLDSIWRKASGQ